MWLLTQLSDTPGNDSLHLAVTAIQEISQFKPMQFNLLWTSRKLFPALLKICIQRVSELRWDRALKKPRVTIINVSSTVLKCKTFRKSTAIQVNMMISLQQQSTFQQQHKFFKSFSQPVDLGFLLVTAFLQIWENSDTAEGSKQGTAFIWHRILHRNVWVNYWGMRCCSHYKCMWRQ